jgi:hypothetical protein
MLVLRRRDFEKLLRVNPNLKHAIERVAKERLAQNIGAAATGD